MDIFTDVVFGGIYSPKYEDRYRSIERNLLNFLDPNQIEYTCLDQSIFERQNIGGCPWCKKDPCRFVFHFGETCKIEDQLRIYRKYINSDKIIFYTDCDLNINNKTFPKDVETVLSFLSMVDIIYQEELNGGKDRWASLINIGINICRPSEKIIKFYEKVLQFMQENSPPATWDQQVVNNMLANKPEISFTTIPNNILFHHRKDGFHA